MAEDIARGDDRRHSRSSSNSSTSRSDSRYDSTTALILESDDTDLFLDLDEDGDEAQSPPGHGATQYISPSLPPSLSLLPSYRSQLFLVVPSLLLGASLLPDALQRTGFGFSSPAFAILWFILLAFLSIFSSQIWIMLGRYIRRWSIEEVVAHALVGSGGKRKGLIEKWRKRIIRILKVAVACTSALLCLTYLREASDTLVRQAVEPTFAGRAIITLFCSTLVSPFLLSSSMMSKRLVLSSLISAIAYVVAIILMATHQSTQPQERPVDPTSIEMVVALPFFNWNGFGILSFSFASPLLTYPLYVSRIVPPNSIDASQQRRPLPYPAHLVFAAALSCILLIPLFFMTPHSPLPNPLLQTLILISGIPLVWVISVSPRLSSFRSSPHAAKWRFALWVLLTVVVVVIPPTIARILQRLVILLVLFIAFPLPAFLHIILHTFRPPLSILIYDDEEQESNLEAGGPYSTPDTLLRRKERSLQRRRLGRRILWDLGVWLILLPYGAMICIWAAGRTIHVW